MTLITVGPAAVLYVCGTQSIQMATVFSIINVILKEHLSDHNQSTQ